MANNIRFTVGGITYSIQSEDSAEYIESLGRELDHKMNVIAKKSPFLSTTMVAVLAAMDAADSAKKAELENIELRRQLDDMTERYAIAKSTADSLKRQAESEEFEEEFEDEPF